MSRLPLKATSLADLQQNDLMQYHSRVLGPTSSRPLEAQYEEDEDGLGYYPDGNKRTLTDDQIKMFRHSEIHRLKLQMLEAAKESDAQPKYPTNARSSSSEAEKTDPKTSTKIDISPLKQGNDDQLTQGEQEQQRSTRALVSKTVTDPERADNADRAISTRRRVRELDEAPKMENVLNYD